MYLKVQGMVPKGKKVQIYLKVQGIHCIPIIAIRPMTRGLHDLWKKVFQNVTDRQTDTQTERHDDSMTETALWGRFSENKHI